MNRFEKEHKIIIEELKKFDWIVEDKEERIVFKKENTKQAIHYLKEKDEFKFVNIKTSPFAVINYINVFAYLCGGKDIDDNDTTRENNN